MLRWITVNLNHFTQSYRYLLNKFLGMNLLKQNCYGHIKFRAIANLSSVDRVSICNPLRDGLFPDQTPAHLRWEPVSQYSCNLHVSHLAWTPSMSGLSSFLSLGPSSFPLFMSPLGCSSFPFSILAVVEKCAFVWHPQRSLGEAFGTLLWNGSFV